MNRIFFAAAFAIGLMTVTWVGVGFVGSSWMALVMTAVIAGVYLLGAFELKQFRAATASLTAALADIAQPLPDIGVWLGGVHPSLKNSVRLRIEGERVGLPGPALTPYLVGLLVMLGMLGTFLGMVVTFKGAVFALEGSTDLHAIRSALAAPIKGLGLAFGTSVAGVAASAMLGLLSTISRRERMDVARQLDALIATVFRPLSLTHQRQETFKALQLQAHALPDVVDKLQAMMEGMERRSQQLNEQLLGSQAQFHREVGAAYTGLADTVGQTLKDSLTASARVAGESLKPVVEAAMTEIAQESNRLHERVSDAAQTQLNGLASAFSATARTVSETWTTALQTHARTSEHQVQGLDRALATFTDRFEQRASTLLSTVSEAASRSQSDQASADRQRLATWTHALESMAATLQSEWQSVGAQTLAQQQAVCETLEKTAGEINARASRHASQTLGDMIRLLAQSEELTRARIDAEAQWVQQHGDRMDQLASVWRAELGALRDEEATRGNAAAARLGELQAAMATHLATLGAALEAPMSRLMQTASEVPQAAAGMMAQLRQEMSRLTERDNLALEERTAVMDKINALLQTINQASGEQQAAIESLAASAAAVMDQASQQFADTLGAQAGQSAEVTAQVVGSAVELASLGESFNHGVQLFNASNEKLMESLQRMEGTMRQSMARSDEQLAYYVGQAREVIDLSITSQQGIVEDLRQLHSKQALLSEGVAG
ncbi:DUF802 domain-containing protein [Polaromonas sp.]|uniref:DUF802 domain-containing protein n=1 Tax=Polaromonas sp. TaxID=1869339 RepID=UPI001D22DCF2|nr:DUF802 domain-containing protein [Polaromonas sp.]MBT9476574.1 DUF802 domain-containing protein [Polaromonas sp.]